MKISTKGKYGLIAMIDLAINYKGSYIPLNVIAERQNLSTNYLEQLFSPLKKSGLVKSVKGPQGGYILGDDPSKITIGAILKVLEGNLSVINTQPTDNLVEQCLKIHLWDKIDEKVQTFIYDQTLEELTNEYIKMNSNSGYMFYI
ncbi:Rrf2 family transcriptional regulator [Serpentinicella sp. ANB-PHB4]|uniref:RrF2 family transcriptional regulator n=1 Tax=Serpentinicella sp. ANB-PHB4 TaxID=3074076 RepID=UPI002862E6DE|nr:Rrf2 family transcriptional regulator [Serpentinicella sp. ANB-PHB4]MDR5659231.1 Rrf2 family transcriptional regulator [Serpentinicella sp. ANB-PHB4]